MNKTEFFSHSSEIQSMIKGLTISKSLFISSIIWGEPYSGKLTLVRFLFPEAIFVDAQDFTLVEELINGNEELVIYNFEAIQNSQLLDFENRRIIAIANYATLPSFIESRFAFIYNMPPLRDRPKDVRYFLEKFSEELKDDLLIKDDTKINIEHLDLSQNFKSFKISLHRELIKKTLSPQDIEEILFDYLYAKIEGNNAYREHLMLYERPLIQAGLKKFKSQLKLSKVLGLNRNTLRKKIHEHDID